MVYIYLFNKITLYWNLPLEKTLKNRFSDFHIFLCVYVILFLKVLNFFIAVFSWRY